MRLCLSFQTEETLTFLGSNYLIILTPWAVASPQHIVCQGHCSGCFGASREAADKRQVLTTREMLSGGPEPARGGEGRGREKKEMFRMLGRDCLEGGVIEDRRTRCLGLEGFPEQTVSSMAPKRENWSVAGLQKAPNAIRFVSPGLASG